MNITDAKWAAEAFEIIKETDPEAYARMERSDWTVYVTDDINDVFSVLGDSFLGLLASLQIGQAISHAFGVTLTKVNAEPGMPPVPEELARKMDNTTWLNRGDIEDAAKGYLEVPVPQFLATVIFHEFRHVEGADELEAGRSGIRFAKKLGADSIVDLATKTLFTQLIMGDR